VLSIDQTLVDEALLQEAFVCDLSVCKGACCVAGDSGAPLEANEATLILDNLDAISEFMTVEGKEVVTAQGVCLKDDDGDWVTPLLPEKGPCAFVFFDAKGIAKCSMEEAYQAGKSSFQKPISCHLYPIRVQKKAAFDILRYDRWDVCKPATACGAKLGVKVFEFLKAPLERKYGAAWYRQLKVAAELLQPKK
jgi:hypothetical protein